ncbi:UDP-N-acetylmuramate dehydrogenase [Candidatus Falkowbacteria bacterium]|nr:UDP-N-acetylmuramate dehydrogenase [Candidatus Falkowbacteria bacterium]
MNDLSYKLSGIQENVSLKPYTTFAIGGPARYFITAKNETEMVRALLAAVAADVPYYILGGGSNLLVSDAGFDGLVIKNENVDFNLAGTRVNAGGGLSLGFFVEQCVEHGLTGAEFLVGIPGSLGGAIRGNAGAWGNGIGEIIETVKVFDGARVSDWLPAQCQFTYRNSFLKAKGHVVISAALQLRQGERQIVAETTANYLRQRNSGQQPTGPSAGCTFQNIPLEQVAGQKIMTTLGITAEEYARVTRYGKLPVGFLLDKIGLKRQRIGGACVSAEHCNFIINDGSATSDDVARLISLIKRRVRDTLGIQLEEEVQYLGF